MKFFILIFKYPSIFLIEITELIIIAVTILVLLLKIVLIINMFIKEIDPGL